MSSNFLNDFFWTRNVNCQSTKSLREECSNDFIVLNHTFSRHATRVYHSILTKVTNIRNRFFFPNIEGLIFQKSFPLKIWKTFQTCKKTKNIRIFIQPSSHPPVHPSSHVAIWVQSLENVPCSRAATVIITIPRDSSAINLTYDLGLTSLHAMY